MGKWSAGDVFRTTKCFSPRTETGYPGGFPLGFMKWVQAQWWGDHRCYLCSGGIEDAGATRVDVKTEVGATHVEDARKTSLPADAYDWVMIDPPYSKELAKRLYGTHKVFGSIDAFTKEAARITAPGGLILTLSYQVPKRITGCDLLACCGIYQTVSVAHMRCFTVWRKRPC